MGFITEQRDTGETGQQLEDGEQGHPHTSGFDEEMGLSLTEHLFTGSHARHCICERGGRWEGALASGYMVSPALAPCPWPVARSTPGLWEARGWGGGRCQPPNYSQCL